MINIKEVIVVEGKDDTANLKKVHGINTIETHGFGISKDTWKELEKAYKECGLVIFTDPDFSGEEIRRRLKERFPKAKEAFLLQEEAKKGNNIGIENASYEDLMKALSHLHREGESIGHYTFNDLYKYGLIGEEDSKEKRKFVSSKLTMGYANGRKFLEKINKYNISREDVEAAVREFDGK